MPHPDSSRTRRPIAPSSHVPCSVPCDVCAAKDVDELSLIDRDGSYLRTVICRQCGLVYSDPRPESDQVRDYYEHNYRLDYKATYTPKPKHVYRSGKVALERLRGLTPFLKPGFRMLDVGAGSGEMVYVLRKLGYEATGLEPNEGYAKYASDVLGMPVTQGFYEDAPIPAGSLNVITMFHVVEHLESPSAAFRHAHRWLAPQGYLLIEVPNVETIVQWPRNRFHRAHLYNFNPATLEMVGRMTGYRAVRCDDGGNISILFQKTNEPRPESGAIPGNFARVSSIVRGHTPMRHLFSRFPYLRPWQKFRVQLDERKASRQIRSPQEMLDGLIAAEFKQATRVAA